MNKLITILLNKATLFGKILLQVLQKKSFALLEHLHQLTDVGDFFAQNMWNELFFSNMHSYCSMCI